jgi:hypothetical protein
VTKGEKGLWILVIAAALHVVEEYLLDWRSWARGLSGVPVQWDLFYAANTGFLLLSIGAACLGWKRPSVSLALPALVLINGLVFHVGPTLVLRQLSPGVVSSVVLYLPIGVWVYLRAAREGVLTRRVAVASVLLGASIMCLPLALIAAIR